MDGQYFSMRNLHFLAFEVFAAQRLSNYTYFQDYRKETIEMTLDAAKKIGDNLLFPIYREMDKHKPKLEDGKVSVHPKMGEIMKTMGEGGWISAALSYDEGGQQMPAILYYLTNFIFHAANTSASSYHGLTAGAANLILTFGSDELKKTYMAEMYKGNWQGTMALTEPQAGSSLGDITTSAEPTDDGHYMIKGQKVFISAGDHDATENVVHLMLAKIKGAPTGTKGISLFVVPRQRIDGDELVGNDVQTAGIETKMGMHGCPIAHLIMGENDACRGYLVGEPHQGLKYMFRMMNEARLSVGMMSTGLSSAAYYASLNYARERPQGRKLSNRDMSTPQIPIIEHADVKRMLLMQKSITEGSLSFIAQCAYYEDLVRVTEGEERAKYKLLVELLTPVAKSYPAEMSIHCTSNGIQVLGGSGYISDYPLEQYYRDTRINPIYEGTTGIQALDLLGRKIPMKSGQALMLFAQEVNQTIAKAAAVKSLKPLTQQLTTAMQKFTEVTMKLMDLAQKQAPEVFLADATLYLENAGLICISWQWLKQGLFALQALETASNEDEINFYKGKLQAMKYYFYYELPKAKGLTERLLNDDRITLEMTEEEFR